MELGDRIKQLRTSKGIAQKEIAVRVGIDQAQYSRVESGKVEPTLSSLAKIATALGIDMVDFFGTEKPIDVNSFDKDIVERLQLVDQLDDLEKRAIFTIIDMAVSKKRLKDTLTNALSVNL
jgi:transcriptional regulator with XRE-family HTH domain